MAIDTKNIINKEQLINIIAKKTQSGKTTATKSLNAVLEAIEEIIGNGQSLKLVNFGTFGVKRLPKRVGRNPQTGSKMTLPETGKVKFTPGRGLREAANKKK